MNLPKISVVIPCYNYGQFLEKAINSVLSQDYGNLELIILDGGSTDETKEILKKYDSNISFWRSEPDLCSNDTVNKGIEISTGDIIGILCADDYYEEGIFKSVAQEFSQDKDVDIVSFYGRYKYQNGEKEDFILSNQMQMDATGEAAPNCRFYKRYVFDNYGKLIIYDRNKEFLLCTDWEMMVRFSLLPIKHKLIDHIGYTYLVHEGSFSYGKDSYLSDVKMLEEHIEVISRYLSKKHLYSKKVVSHFKKTYFKATIKLHIVFKLKGDFKKSEYYKNIGIKEGFIGWYYRMFKVKRKKNFRSWIKKIVDSDNLVRVQKVK